eukprot:1144598-Pelagomonas_calceolata.AAC.1
MQDRTVAYGKQYGTRIAIGLAQQQSPRSTVGKVKYAMPCAVAFQYALPAFKIAKYRREMRGGA